MVQADESRVQLSVTAEIAAAASTNCSASLGRSQVVTMVQADESRVQLSVTAEIAAAASNQLFC